MFRVRTIFTGIQGSPWVNTLHFFSDGVATAQDCVTKAGAFWGAVDTNMVTSAQWATDAEVEELSPVTGDVEEVHTTTPVTGQGSETASTLLPIAVQVICRLRTGVFIAGREIRGRINIPAVSELHSDSGLLTTAAQTTFQTALSTLVGDTGAVLGVWSRTHAQIQNVSSSSVSRNFGVLTSRRD